MNYMEIKYPDAANGFGVRVSLFVSGCHHHCKECFNPESWDRNAGQPFTQKEKDLIMEKLALPYVTGLSLLGGEPMEEYNAGELADLCEEVKQRFPDKDIWCWTGFLADEIVPGSRQSRLLHQLDVLVDGPFVLEKKRNGLLFRGSTNQRLIDVQASLKTGLIQPLKVDERKGGAR